MVGLLIALLATACGDDDAAPVDAASGGGAEVTIEHSMGSATVAGTPERIVTLGLQWTDAVLSLGVQPVGFVHDPLAGENGRYPWHDDLLAEEAVALEVEDGLPLEQIAALDPDLILVVPYLVEDQAVYDSLAQLAPTISGLSNRQVDPWRDLVEIVGDVLGRDDQAATVIAGVEERLAEAAAELPGLRGKTFALANYVPGDSIYVVADESDGSSVFFQTFGMHLAPDLLAAADGVSGRAQLSLERADLLAADLLVLFANDGDPSDLVGYDALPPVLSGATAVVDYVEVVGLNTPTPLSIPFSLEAVRPALEAAAG